MANKNFNPQIRKMFDNGSGKPKSKDTLDRNPNRTMSPEMKRRVSDIALRKRKQEEIKKIKSEKNKPQDKKMERRTKAIEPIKKPKKNTIKDKLNKVGNMKVKDAAKVVGKAAAKVVGKAALAGTPIGAAKNVTDTFKKNFKFQSPIVRKNRKFGGK